MSAIGWVDFSSNERKRVQDVLALLTETGTLDELGVGPIRDAFSDLLFPGFSTIQTGAKYFIAVPQILRDWAALPATARRSTTMEQYLQDRENELAKEMSANHQRLGRALDGIIGHTLTERGGAERRPSSTYWNGLRQFGIVATDLSLAEFCRSFQASRKGQAIVKTDEGFDDDPPPEIASVIKCASPHDGAWMTQSTLGLTRPEAQFLLDKLQAAPDLGDTVAAQLITTGLMGEALELGESNFLQFHDWATRKRALSATCKHVIGQAQRFSLAMEGAHIRLNALLAARARNEELLSELRDELVEWGAQSAELGVFHEGAVEEWLAASGVRSLKSWTRDFLLAWNEAVLRKETSGRLDELVYAQADNNKGPRSLLQKNPPVQDKWVGIRSLDYRWPTVRRMLSDIDEGLAC